MQHRSLVLELRVRIVRANYLEIGMVFQFRNELEREAVKSVVASAKLRAVLGDRLPPF